MPLVAPVGLTIEAPVWENAGYATDANRT